MFRCAKSGHLYFLIHYIYLSSGLIVDDKTSQITFLNFGEEHQLIAFSHSKSSFCLRPPPFWAWFYLSFKQQALSVTIKSISLDGPKLIIRRLNSLEELRASQWFDSDNSLYYPLSATDIENESSDFFRLQESRIIPLSRGQVNCFDFVLAVDEFIPYISCNVSFISTWDVVRIFKVLLGISLYIIAPILSENILFYYISGMGLSVVGSLLILFILCLRLLPKRTSILLQGLVFVGGSAISVLVFCIDYIRSLFLKFASRNVYILVFYAVSVAFFTGGILYWFSFPEKLISNVPRTKSLLRWLIRLIGVFLIVATPQLPNQILSSSFIHVFNEHVFKCLGIDSESALSIILTSNVMCRFILGLLVIFILHFLLAYTITFFKSPLEPNVRKVKCRHCSLVQPLDVTRATPSPLNNASSDYFWPPFSNSDYPSPLYSNSSPNIFVESPINETFKQKKQTSTHTNPVHISKQKLSHNNSFQLRTSVWSSTNLSPEDVFTDDED